MVLVRRFQPIYIKCYGILSKMIIFLWGAYGTGTVTKHLFSFGEIVSF